MRPLTSLKLAAGLLAGALSAPALAVAGPLDTAPDATGVTPTDKACPIVFEVRDAGNKLLTGYQVAVDKSVDPDHQPSYEIDTDPAGKASFSGGGMTEITGQLKDGKVEIDGAAKTFDVEVVFPGHPAAAGIIHRQCGAAAAHLVYFTPAPDAGYPFGGWRWVEP